MAISQIRYKGKIIDGVTFKSVNGAKVLYDSTNHTYTDILGWFVIYAEEMDSLPLIISHRYYGQKKLFLIKGKPLIILKKGNKKKYSNSSIAPSSIDINSFGQTFLKIKKEEISAPSSVAFLLQHKLPGLTVSRPGNAPNGMFQIYNRGISSATQRISPTIIIDGIPETSLARINPEDMAFINITKSAVGTAKHGALGGGGVIEINTPEYDSILPLVQYHSSLSMESVQQDLAMMDAGEYLKHKPDFNEGHNTNWIKEVTRNSLSHRHHLAINKGNKNSGIYASLGYQKENGTLKRSGFEQGNVRFNFTKTNDKKKNKIYFKNSFLQRDINFSDIYLFRDAIRRNPTRPASDPPYSLGNIERRANLSRTREWSSSFKFENQTSAYNKHNFHIAFRHRKNMFGEGTIGNTIDFVDYDKKHIVGGFNQFSHSYLKRIKTKNHFGIQGSYLNSFEHDFSFGLKEGIQNFNNYESKRKEYKDIRKTAWNRASASAFWEREHRLKIWQLNYGIRYDRFFYKEISKGELFFHGQLQMDISDLFKINKLDHFRFSMGYGKAGQPASYNFDLRGEQIINNFGGEYLITIIEDKDALIEIKKEVDVQLDISFFNGRLKTTINLYDNVLQNQILDPFVDFRGELGNKGIEALIELNHQFNNGISWSSRLGFHTNKSVAYRFYGSGEETTTRNATNSYVRRSDQKVEHYKELGVFYGYHTEEELFDGQYQRKDLDGDGVPDRVALGSSLPKLGSFFTNHFSKGKWDAVLKMRSLIGHHLRNEFREEYEVIKANKYNMLKTKYFNENVTQSNGFLLDVYLENASFLKLDYLSIGYQPTIKKGKLRLYLAGHDLLTITGYTGVDPEPRYQQDGIAISTGVESQFTYFRSRRFVFGVQWGW